MQTPDQLRWVLDQKKRTPVSDDLSDFAGGPQAYTKDQQEAAFIRGCALALRGVGYEHADIVAASGEYADAKAIKKAVEQHRQTAEIDIANKPCVQAAELPGKVLETAQTTAAAEAEKQKYKYVGDEFDQVAQNTVAQQKA